MNKEKISKRMFYLRLKANLTQSELAERAHISSRTVWKIENQSGNPKWGTIAKICKALNVDPVKEFLDDFIA